MHQELFFWSCEDHGQALGVVFLVVQMPRAGVVVQRPRAGIRFFLFGRVAASPALEASYTAAGLGHGQASGIVFLRARPTSPSIKLGTLYLVMSSDVVVMSS